MSSSLIQVTIALTFGASIATPSGAAYASTSVVVTDSTGTAQPAVNVTPASPSFTASVAVGAGSVVAQDVDVNGAVLGSPVTQSFTEVGSPPSFTPTTGITVTPVGAAAAALRRK
jgi:hypothetical protein